MSELTIKEIHDRTTDILRYIDSVCKEQNIKYYAMFGTAIGAIRHHGFIPWDDDLDIGMFRKDYETFCSYMKNNKNDNYYLDNKETNTSYPYYISRVCEKECCANFEGFKYKSGLFVDIYPLDGMGNKKDEKYWEDNIKKRIWLKKGLVLSKKKLFFVGKNKIKSFVKSILYLLPCTLSKVLGYSFFYERLDEYKNVYSLDESTYIGVPCWASDNVKFMKIDFDDTLSMIFEDFYIPVPIGYDRVLRTCYGDYMVPPPPNKQIQQHGYTATKK